MKPQQSPFRAARRASVPLLFIETADPAATMRRCAAELNGEQEQIPILRWDCVNGLVGANEPGKELATVVAEPQEPAMLTNPTELLAALAGKASKLCVTVNGKKRGAVVNLIHLNRFMDNPGVVQGIWNCRDALKAFGVSLVALGPRLPIPPELTSDVVLISEPLPAPDELGAIVDSVCGDAGIDSATLEDRPRIVDTLTGVSAFGAENIFSMSLTREGVNLDTLTERQRKMIEQTPGLSIYRGNENMKSVGGHAELVARAVRILGSKTVPLNAILFCDELEKQWAGSLQGANDGGTSSDQLGKMLEFLNDFRIALLLMVGPGGTGKSLIAKAMGGLSKRPVIKMDFGAMKSGIVGSSEERIRKALDISLAVSGGKLIMVATCNRINSLPAEVRRRITKGVYMVDLPNGEEKSAIWRIHIADLGLPDQALPNDQGWTGAEIRACCDNAYCEGLSLVDAARLIVPISRSAPDQVEAIRKLAHGRFLSSSYPGFYRMPADESATQTTGRKMEL